jgi:hypothetical protein
MATEENTFHLTYEDGKTVSFQVYDEKVGEQSPIIEQKEDNRTWLREMLRRPKSTTATICCGTEPVGKENEAQIDEDNELWELYMKAQYSSYREREVEQDEVSTESDISDQGNIKLDRITVEEVNMGEEEDMEMEIHDLQEDGSGEGLLQAKEKAMEARRKWSDRASKQGRNSLSSSSSSSSRRLENEEILEGQHEEEMNDDDTKDNTVFLQTGPFRWTPIMMTGYMKQYTNLEGKLWVHPRTRRLYEVTNVFFYEKEQVAAAYSRVRDGGQADVTDHFPHRIEGKLGIAELIDEFEKGGGSLGTSRTRWPTTEEEWATLQDQDALWGPIISELKEEREEALKALPPVPKNASKEEKQLYAKTRKEVKVYGKEKGRVLVRAG